MKQSAGAAHRVGMVFLALLAASLAQPGTDPAAAAAPALDGTIWTLTDVAGQRLPEGSTATLGFQEGRVQGTDGCNRYSGPYSLTGPVLRIGPDLVSTRMACPEQIMAQADAFLAALIGARGYRISNGELRLLSADGRLLARFKGR